MEDALHGLLAARIPRGQAAAMAVRHGHRTRHASLNVQPAAGPQPGGPGPQFLIYSLTKTFIAALALKLCADGRLGLDDSIVRWFPRLEGADRISLRMLLNHTVGIPDYRGLAEYHQSVAAFPSQPWTFEEFTVRTYERGLAYPPGRGWDYSNPAYMLLRRILEEASGEPFSTLLADRIIRPLGLHDTSMATSVGDLARLVPATSRRLSLAGDPMDVRQVYHPGWVAHGVLISTPGDIVHFFHHLLAEGLLPTSLLAEMTRLVPVPGDPSPPWSRRGWGLGLKGGESAAHGALYGHTGEGPGYAACALHASQLPGGAAMVCVMAAVEDSDLAERIAFAALDALAD